MANLAIEATSSGIVAEKSKVWRVSFVLSIARRIFSMAGRKPMSKSWSASSKTNVSRLSHMPGATPCVFSR
jgi:hypothetical protein